MDKDLNMFEFHSMVDINKFNHNKKDISKQKQIKGQHIDNFLQFKALLDYNDFPMYFGYYFREAYRTAVSNLMKLNLMASEKMIMLMDDPQTFVIENEIFLPKVANKFTEKNQKHVINSLQGLSYWNSYIQEDSKCYKTRKVRLPFTECTKLAIFDLDETLIHCLPFSQFSKNQELIDFCDVSLDCDFNPEK